MPSDTQHWNQIFANKSEAQLGWFEPDVSQTLKFIEMIDLPLKSSVFIPGAGTSTLVDVIADKGWKLVLNDISDIALAQLNTRLGEGCFEFLHHNMAERLQSKYEIDLWIDRAVLHFLLTEEEIVGYFENLKACVKKGGVVLLAEFSKNGARKCAGLDIRQYSIADMQNYLGGEFDLLRHEEFNFINPFGQNRPYLYGLFRRR